MLLEVRQALVFSVCTPDTDSTPPYNFSDSSDTVGKYTMPQTRPSAHIVRCRSLQVPILG